MNLSVIQTLGVVFVVIVPRLLKIPYTGFHTKVESALL